MRKNNGVSMLVLVIIIAILAILAGIAIFHVAGDHGVVNKAVEMEVETAKAEVRDHILQLLNIELVSASKDIAGSTDDISTRFNEPKLINFLKGTPNYADDKKESEVIKCIEEFDEKEKGVIDIKPKGGEGTIKNKYRVIPEDLCKDTDVYGTGKYTSDGNIFTLEAVYESVGEDGTPTGYNGDFELKYYDKNKKASVLEKVSLYLTNQS